MVLTKTSCGSKQQTNPRWTYLDNPRLFQTMGLQIQIVQVPIIDSCAMTTGIF